MRIKKSGFIRLIIVVLFFIPFQLIMTDSAGFDQVLSLLMQDRFDRQVTLDLRDMDIVDVYKFLAMKGDFSIVVSKTVSGRATLVLKNVKIGDALDIISIANGLGYRAMQNIIYVMPEEEYFQMYGTYFRDKTIIKTVYLKYVRPSYALEALKNVKSEVGKIVIDEDTGTIVMIDTPDKIKEMEKVLDNIDHRLQTKVFSLNYAKAAIVKEKLRDRLDVKSVGSIEADERSNQVIVTALADRFPEIEPLILALDKKTKEVLIKVKILKLVLNPEFDFGISWDTALNDTLSDSPGLRSLQLFGTFPISTTIAGTLGRIFLTDTIDPGSLDLDIMALKQVSDTKTLANPTILVTNNDEAKIHIGDKLAYVTTTTTGTGADQTTNEEVHFVDVGILLSVKPIISDDGFIRMVIKPEISSQTSTYETPAGAEIPLINTTQVETSVMVKHGTTIIIGGLHKDEAESRKKGIPFLMDIPFLGLPFKNVADDVKKTEIVIILTPYIVSGENTITGYTPIMEPMKQY